MMVRLKVGILFLARDFLFLIHFLGSRTYSQHNALIPSEATGPGKGQVSVFKCASPWIDLLAHTVLNEITEITHISLLH